MEGKRTLREMKAATGISRNALDKRIKRLGIVPVDKMGITNLYSEEDYQKVITYVPKGAHGGKSPGKATQFYRVSVRSEDDYLFYVKHAGLSKNRAMKKVKEYAEQGLIARAIPC